MLVPLRIRCDLEIASKVLFVVRAARFAEKITPTIWCALAINENRRTNPLNAAEGTLRAGGTARPMAADEPPSEQVEADCTGYDSSHLAD